MTEGPRSAIAILCPLCREPLDRQASVWRCSQNHSFDVARDGYVNLLPVQHKASLEPGDKPEMVTARREFLAAGHYAPLRDAAVDLLSTCAARTLLDVGCGEGYYTQAFTMIAAEVIGLDIAKAAVQLAAKRGKRAPAPVTWLVANGALLPFADGSIENIASLFTPLHGAELQRVLAPEGHLLIATPAADHLLSVRQGLFEDVRPHEPEKFIDALEARFAFVRRQDVRVPLALTQATLKQLLLMTPYVWKARPEKRAALEASETFETEAAFSLLLFRKRSERRAI